MLSKKEIKLWLRSGSLQFAKDSRPGTDKSGKIRSIQWNGHHFYYRVGTSDTSVMHSILLKSGKKAEYFIDQDIDPKVIFDIGGNIGCAAVFFAKMYPNAKIFSFEPILSNFDILSKNISGYENIKAFNLALGESDGTMDLIESPDEQNFGGFSMYQRGATECCQKTTVQSRHIGSFMNDMNVVPDLIKVDTEGAEYTIITSIPDTLLQRVQYIIGELHGERDFELLAHLSRYFNLGMKKSMHNTLFNFSGKIKVDK